MSTLTPLVDYFPCACAWQKHHLQAWTEWTKREQVSHTNTAADESNQTAADHSKTYLALVPPEWRYKFCAETLLPCSPWFHYHIPEEQKPLFTTKYLDLAFCHPSAMKTFIMQSKHRVQAHTQVLMQHAIMTDYKHPYWLVFPLAPRPIREPFCLTTQSMSLHDAFHYTDHRMLVEWVNQTWYTGPPAPTSSADANKR